MQPGASNQELTGSDWSELIYSVVEKSCLPFIGPGASDQWLHLNGIVERWMQEFEYPYSLDEYSQLSRVAQFIAKETINEDLPKERLSREIKNMKNIPDFSLPEFQNTVYSLLADLNLPIYITTNYDHLMEKALHDRGGKKPRTESCRWNQNLANLYMEVQNSALSKRGRYVPSEAEPLVFHLHGDVDNPSSMVLTEKDYIDFAIFLSKSGGMNDEKTTLPTSVRQSIRGSKPLFLGYRLEEISFIVVFEAFIKLMSFKNKSIAVQVQMPPKFEIEKEAAIQQYLKTFTKEYFKIAVYGFGADTFLQQLRDRLISWRREKQG